MSSGRTLAKSKDLTKRHVPMYFPYHPLSPHRMKSPYNPYSTKPVYWHHKSAKPSKKQASTQTTAVTTSDRIIQTDIPDTTETSCQTIAVTTSDRKTQTTNTATSEKRSQTAAVTIIDQSSPRGSVRVLAPIRTVQTTLTEHREYTLDPFCVTHRDFQHRAEDELAKYLYYVLDNAWNKSQKFKCKNPDSRKSEPLNISIEEALEGPALDLRWQLGHLLFDYNRIEFFNVFPINQHSKLNQNGMCRLLEFIKDEANKMAHKQYLQDDKRQPASRHADAKSRVTAESGNILTLLDDMIELVEFMTELECDEQNGSDHVTNLHKIRKDYKRFIEYKVKFYENEQAFKRMAEAKQRTTAVKMLTDITAHCSSDSKATDLHKMVALQVCPRLSRKFQPDSI